MSQVTGLVSTGSVAKLIVLVIMRKVGDFKFNMTQLVGQNGKGITSQYGPPHA